VTSVRAKGKWIDAFHRLDRERAIEVRKQGAAARGLPFQGIAKLAGIHADKQQIALTCKMLCGGLRNLGRSREMNEIVATIGLRAAENTGSLCLLPQCSGTNFVQGLHAVYVVGVPTIIQRSVFTGLAREGRELVERLEAMRNDLMAKAVELDTTRQKANKKSKDASGA
jgi:hypothetical protein